MSEDYENLYHETEIRLEGMTLRLEYLAEAMHNYADAIGTVNGMTESLGVKEMMFLFIDRLRNIIRGKEIGTPRLERLVNKNDENLHRRLC